MAADWSALLVAAEDEARRFANALRDPAASQREVLARILADNADCAFGKAHGFAGIASVADYWRAVPVRSYADFRPEIDRIAGGEPAVLTSERVIAFEETGGTRSGGKLIPYTARGLADFRRAVLPWLGDLARRRPAACTGRAYVTISPATRQPCGTTGGLAIGLDTDAAYLGADLAPAFAGVLAVPPEVGGLADPAEWQVATLRALVVARDLSFVSLWSPTFLLALIEGLVDRAEAVLAGLDHADRRRLERALAGGATDTAMLWPALDCISCWTDGASAPFARRLGEVFAHAAIDAKGLLATEAAVTVPWGDDGGCVPALTGAFIEFHDRHGEPHLCDALDPGGHYRVIVTTASGLYRYDLGDIVECTGMSGGVPTLRFAGRGDGTSDLVGEKLEDGFVAATLASLPCPAVLVAASAPPGYVLASEAALDPATLARFEARLCTNPQYAHARAIGQLAPLRLVHRPGLSGDMVRNGLAAGRRMGDLKPVALVPPGGAGWLDL